MRASTITELLHKGVVRPKVSLQQLLHLPGQSGRLFSAALQLLRRLQGCPEEIVVPRLEGKGSAGSGTCEKKWLQRGNYNLAHWSTSRAEPPPLSLILSEVPSPGTSAAKQKRARRSSLTTCSVGLRTSAAALKTGVGLPRL